MAGIAPAGPVPAAGIVTLGMVTVSAVDVVFASTAVNRASPSASARPIVTVTMIVTVTAIMTGATADSETGAGEDPALLIEQGRVGERMFVRKRVVDATIALRLRR